MNHQQAKLGQVAEILTPSVNTAVRAILAFLTIMFLRAILGYTILAKIIIILISGDLEAEHLPFPYLVMSFLVYFGLFELSCSNTNLFCASYNFCASYRKRRHNFNPLIENESWWDADRDRLKEKLVMSVNYSPFR
ncbi:uncharacterized protein NECHADRAFT_83992 [Fusarium vanettenii 77-13-4]|uniref:Uncharacterized protein n=1 Tax=Fusarium vanettenii (strain ATCC MYA-4622 / CBS 123669 / FGSC 9596 / NRRL 45880 / 77-13-4) TaxID=660122 RepID=C7YZD5_FUSV7|nr:uncharacterized protein NECHADRAFT_83992 [Fusarium vanettenii 77-13-4]EEU42785.1 predicted protein [Fusarium vanettenii 77-13-4]